MRASHRSLDDWLDDIEQNAAKVVAHTSAMTFEQFVATEPVRDLVQKKLENMGEATQHLRRLHPGYVETVPGIAWRELGDMRNRLAHGYFDVSPAILWRVAIVEVPLILAEVRRVIAHRTAQSGSAP